MAAAAGTEPAAAIPEPAATTAETASPPLQLILDRRSRLLKVMEGGRERRRFRVGVGMPGWETPVGSFSVIEKTAYPIWEHPAKGVRIPPGPTNPLGSRWIGFHRDCTGRRGFNGQEHLEVKGCVTSGFHGTPNRDSVGGAVSHGCVRLFDEDVRELFEMVQVGTPVTVLP
ncbi:MAG: L,D-transpeptidase [Cyanobacteria bacterium K_Offshore_surface_m2_011]|nr:L,D-transpeptidase [Cyanobacteria bacterium K_Offshore_surface_m2_011]